MAKNDFHGQHVLVTGGGSGIGRALALAFAEAGAAKVTITDIDQQRLDTVVAELQAKGSQAQAFRVDHSSEQETKGFCDKLLAEIGDVDVVCANAGIGDSSTLEGGNLARWRTLIDINVMGVAYLLHYLAPSMIKRQQGSILITASGAGLVPGPGMSIYHASKAAARSLGESLRCELAQHGISVSVLCPGVIRTNIAEECSIDLGSEEENAVAAKKFKEAYSSKKAASPDLVARDALNGLRRKQMLIASPKNEVGIGWHLYRLFPNWFIRMATRKWIEGEAISGIKVR